MTIGCLCRDETHPNPNCLMHGQTKSATRPTRNGIKRKTVLRPVSDEQALKNERWAGIKEGILAMQRRYEADGKAHCEDCGIAGDDKTLDLHHLRSRAQGGHYSAANAALLCNRFSKNREANCHDRVTGKPEWSNG